MRNIYLAGPILGCDKSEANDWRVYANEQLMQRSNGTIRGISPLRCEPLIGERYVAQYADPKFGTSRAIGSKNIHDVRECDITLAYLPIIDRPGWTQSYGTIIEIGWAHALGKQVIVVSDDPKVQSHPVINTCCGWMLSDLDDGLDVVLGLLHGYEGGKNV